MHRLRLLALGIVVGISASALTAATAYYAESAVTLQLTIQQTGQSTETAPDADGVVVRETKIETRRLGNAELLEEMVRRSLIPKASGYSVVAVWANWPDEKPFKGSAFRLFVRKVGAKAPALTRVPQEVFALTPTDWLHERNILRKAGAIKSGADGFEAYSKLDLGIGGVSGTLLGAEAGRGVFKAPPKSSKLQYVPALGTMTLEGTAGGGLCSAQIAFAPARFVSGADFKPNALPKNTTVGGYYAYSSMMLLANSYGWLNWYVPPYVHYFCPLSVELTLKREEIVPSSEKGRETTRISTATVSADDLLRGALHARGVEDAAGWGLYVHARSDSYSDPEDFDLVAAHADGRILSLGGAGLTLSSTRAEEARREYRSGVYTAGTIRELAHATYNRGWTLADGDTLSLLVTGAADSQSLYGLIPVANGSRETQPVSTTARLFGSYDKNAESGLAGVTVAIGAPLPQADIPAGWGALFAPYAAPVPITLSYDWVRSIRFDSGVNYTISNDAVRNVSLNSGANEALSDAQLAAMTRLLRERETLSQARAPDSSTEN